MCDKPYDVDFLMAVYDMEAKGFGGMLTGRLCRKTTAEKLVERGLLQATWLDPTDADGNAREGCKPRRGYRLTGAGQDAIPEGERWRGDLTIDETKE